MRHRHLLLTRLACMLLAAVIAGLPLATAPAGAQELIGRCQGLFGCLFGGQRVPSVRHVPAQQRNSTGPRYRRKAPAATERSRSRVRSRSTPRAAAPATPPPPPEVDKLDNARVVLVVGDFLAGGLAEGLEDAYAQSPGVEIVDRSNGSSGFVRQDYFNWNAEIGSILDEVKPAAVVVMIGSNDRQQIPLADGRVDPRSDPWTKEYVRRIDAFTKAITSRKLPLVWSGLPAFKSPSMTSDILAFNDLYKQQVEAAGGQFVDIWDGFVDEGGNFIFTGPDMNGQPVRLRGSDGINLTQAGKRKVAFYVERPLAKILGNAISPDVDSAAINRLPESALIPVKPGDMDRTQPISLLGPDLDGGTVLLGGDKKETAKARDGKKGAFGDDPPAGRADDFSLTPHVPDKPKPDPRTTTAIGN